jgi:hypothetical protein
MTDVNPAEPPRGTRGMLVATCVAVALIAVALIFFVASRGGADGTLPGAKPADRQNVPSGGTAEPGGSGGAGAGTGGNGAGGR